MRLFIFTRKTWPQQIIAAEGLINQENIFLPSGAPVRLQSQSTNRVRRFLSASKNLLVLEKVILTKSIEIYNCFFIKGWKIMPDDGQQNIDDSALKSVVSIIKDMELKVFFLVWKLQTPSNQILGIRCAWENQYQSSVTRFGDSFTTFIYHLIWKIYSNSEKYLFFSSVTTFYKQIKCTE